MLHTVSQVSESTGINYYTLRSAILRLQLKPVALLSSRGRPYQLFNDEQVERLVNAINADTVKLEEVLDDLLLLAEGGVGATEAAQRVGYHTPASLYRALYRHHHHSLARRLYANDGVGAKVAQHRKAA